MLVAIGDPAILEAFRVGRVKNLEVVTIELSDAAICGGPDVSLSCLQEGRDRVVGHSVVGGPGLNRKFPGQIRCSAANRGGMRQPEKNRRRQCLCQEFPEAEASHVIDAVLYLSEQKSSSFAVRLSHTLGKGVSDCEELKGRGEGVRCPHLFGKRNNVGDAVKRVPT